MSPFSPCWLGTKLASTNPFLWQFQVDAHHFALFCHTASARLIWIILLSSALWTRSKSETVNADRGTLLSTFQCHSSPGIWWILLGGFKQGAEFKQLRWSLKVGSIAGSFQQLPVKGLNPSIIYKLFTNHHQSGSTDLQTILKPFTNVKIYPSQHCSTAVTCEAAWILGQEAEGFVTGLLQQRPEAGAGDQRKKVRTTPIKSHPGSAWVGHAQVVKFLILTFWSFWFASQIKSEPPISFVFC